MQVRPKLQLTNSHQLQPEIEQRQVRMQPSLDLLLGTAYMRLGEQVNCLEGHATASCPLPHRPRRRPTPTHRARGWP